MFVATSSVPLSGLPVPARLVAPTLTDSPGPGVPGSDLAKAPKQLGLPLSTGGSASAVPDRLITAAATTAIVSSK